MAARRRLAAIASGDGLLLHTACLGRRLRTPEQAAHLVRRAAEARLLLAYARGCAVTHLDSSGDSGREGDYLLCDVAATVRPTLSAAMVEELMRSWPTGAVHDRVLRPMWRATRFIEAHQPLRDRDSGDAPLLCAPPGRVVRPINGYGEPYYDPVAHVLRVERDTVMQGASADRLARLMNPLLLDVPWLTSHRLTELCGQLDPDRQPGRLILRLRGPGDMLVRMLADFAVAARQAGHSVVWLVAPDGRRAEHLATLVAGAASGVCLGGPGRVGEQGEWLLDRSAQLAAKLLI